ncbi:MAG TPA: hypothetical protein VFH06_03760 [Candidatus Saccharimonadales bacterium]|nr:hypothetical protein [Candidatus Saccharimonadales bacterium]
MRLWDEARDEKRETPLDAFGRVDLDGFVELVKSTVAAEYRWESPFNDVHHLQWPATAYMHYEDPVAVEFRETAWRKAFLPRLFHNWGHKITHEPPLPSLEVMRHTVEAHKTVRDLAATARLAARLTRTPGIPEVKLWSRLEEELDAYTVYIENAREVPLEFQLLKLEEVEAQSIDEMLTANRRLGKLAVQHIPIVARRLQMV